MGCVTVRVAIVGDYQPDHETHPATTAAVGHAGDDLGVEVEVSWIATADVDGGDVLAGYDGIWIAPGSPYRSMEGALTAIGFARTSGTPLLGTCAGFQHIVVEYARNVVGDTAAQHAEYDPTAASLLVTPLACSLAGRTFEVAVSDGTRARMAYGRGTAVERYYCNFGLNPDKEPALAAAGLRVSGRDETGEARIVEIGAHTFFMGTRFVPQVASLPGHPHPLVRAFVRSSAIRRQP